MKITDLKLTVVELPWKKARPVIVEKPIFRRTILSQASIVGSEPAYEQFLHVMTDEGIEGVCTATGYITNDVTPAVLQVLRDHAIGEDPLNREKIYQKLQYGTRFLYLKPGWFGHFDNCLWDIAGKVAGLPICKLLGQVRERIPAYYYSGGRKDSGDSTLQDFLEDIEFARDCLAISAFKVGIRKGARSDISVIAGLRERLGPEPALMNDAACSLTLEEAIKVGHAMEEHDFVWLEEPMREQELRQYQELCRALTMPVMGTEMLMHDMNIAAQWLLAGATDVLRGNAGNSTTSVLKMAHFAELYGAMIELNGDGDLGGHAHVQLQCAIANTRYHEFALSRDQRDARVTRSPTATEAGITNLPVFKDGYLYPSELPGWGAEIDWDHVKKHTVAVY